MKITKQRLRQIIKEELEEAAKELHTTRKWRTARRVRPPSARSSAADTTTQLELDPMLKAAEAIGIAVEDLKATLEAEGLSIIAVEDLPVELEEVYSQKQRDYMCAMKDAPAAERPKGLSQDEAEEMCYGPDKK